VPIPKFFSDYLTIESSESLATVNLLMEGLPAKFDEIAETDRLILMSVINDSIRSTLSPIFSRAFEVELNEHLSKIQSLSREIQGHISAVSDITFLGESSFRQAWLKQMFGARPLRTREGRLVEIPEIPDSDSWQSPSPRSAAFALEDVARGVLIARLQEAPQNRPAENLLPSVLYPLIRAWSALELMAGACMDKAFPSKRNEGHRWCIEVIHSICSGDLVGDNRLGKKRKDRTIREEIGRTNTELKRRLLDTPFCEPVETWPTISWDSYCGVDLLFRAAMPPGRDCLLRDNPFIDDFDRRYQDWLMSNERSEPPIWLDDV
jgi:hypothetical protein